MNTTGLGTKCCVGVSLHLNVCVVNRMFCAVRTIGWMVGNRVVGKWASKLWVRGEAHRTDRDLSQAHLRSSPTCVTSQHPITCTAYGKHQFRAFLSLAPWTKLLKEPYKDTTDAIHSIHPIVKEHSPPWTELKIPLNHPGRKQKWENKSCFCLLNIYFRHCASELPH